MKISYAIPVCNEHNELNRLLSALINNKRSDDEIVVQGDLGNVTDEVKGVIEKYSHSVKYIEFPLNKDFATFKNNLKSNCTGDWIFQIDADETLSPSFIEHLHLILLENENIEVISIPRINTVTGITSEHVKKWKWNVNEKGWINFPDYQTRILKNLDKIKWVNKVHEILTGNITFGSFPSEEDFCLIHEKSIERQEKQNSFYNLI